MHTTQAWAARSATRTAGRTLSFPTICRKCPALAALALVTATAAAVSADTTYNDGAAHTINTSVAGLVSVSAATGTTTLNVVPNGAVQGGANQDALQISAGGLVNVSGGGVTGGSAVNGNANAISMNGGALNISAGTITGGTIQGGGTGNALTVGFLGGTVNITGGMLKGGAVTTGGGGAGAIWASAGTVTVRSGTIQGGSAGQPGEASAGIYDAGATINIYGGTILPGSSGSLTPALYFTHGTMNIYGTNFNYPYGALTSGSGTLTGILSDGSPLNAPFKFESPSVATMNLVQQAPVPEPASLSLLALGTIPLLTRRKRSV
jgi:hypothetical protein